MSHYPTIQTISNALMEPEARRLNKIVVDLNNKNKKLHETTTDGFLYFGVFHVPKQNNLILADWGHQRTKLHLSLHEDMEDYMKDRVTVKTDMLQIEQMLYILIKSINGTILEEEDIRDALPECVVSVLPELAKLSRTRVAAYTIRDDPRAMEQYLRILPKMEVYSNSRLFY